jgi:hypothetical protein
MKGFGFSRLLGPGPNFDLGALAPRSVGVDVRHNPMAGAVHRNALAKTGRARLRMA